MKREPLWYLKDFNIFQGVSEPEMDAMSEMIRTDEIKRNNPIYLQGDRAQWVYFLKEGLVRLDMTSEGGKVATIALLKPGEIFGELTSSEPSNTATEAIALEDSYLCRISRERFMDLLTMHAGMMLTVNKILGLRVQRIQIAVKDLIFLDVPGRLAKLLHSLVETDSEKVVQGHRIKYRLSHQELANLIGATREMVSVVIGRWVREGLVIQASRRLIIPDPNQLSHLYNET